jgi:hypothetical protein
MNWLKKGPELKRPEMKIPDFAYDLFYDLKERHLLPLVAILLIAIVAVPIYVKSSTKSDSEDLPRTTPVATGSNAGGGGSIVVARSAPGLRDYKRRLKGARALDPFARKGEAPSGSAAGQAGGEEAPAPEPSTPPPVEVPAEATVVGGETSYSPPETEALPPIESPPPPEATSVGSGPSVGSTGGRTRTRYASSAIDVRIVSVPAGSAAADAKSQAKSRKPTAQIRRDVPELTMLPARGTPAATFMGTSRDGKKALMLVSSDVVSIFGEANCVIGSKSCQLLALEPGMPETFIYGPQERTFRIEVLKIEQTLSAKPRRATLGATKHKGPAEPGHSTGTERAEGEATGSEPAGRG